MNILFTCAGRRNYLINYFKEALKGNGLIIAADMQLTAPAMISADKACVVPSIYDPQYINSILEVIKEYDVDALISLNDLELPILSNNIELFDSVNTKIILSDNNTIDITHDKWKTSTFLNTIGLKSPKTYLSLETAIEALSKNEISFPLVIKPRWGSASIGIEIVDSIRELELAYQLQKIKLRKTILNEVSAQDINHALLIQEMIKGNEYGIDVLNDFNSNYIGTFARQKLSMRAGETDKAISVIDEKISQVGRMLGENLKHIGNLDCDIFYNNGEIFVLEMNPRFGGGYPFSHEAGVNTAAIYLEWLKGNSDIANFINYKDGVMHSKYDNLMKIVN